MPQSAIGLALVTGLVGFVVFAFSRTIVSPLCGARSAMRVYIASPLLVRHRIVAIFGAGRAACQ